MSLGYLLTKEEVELNELAQDINTLVQSAEFKFKQGFEDVCRIGEKLLEAKTKVKRTGNSWVDWVEKNLEITYRQVTKYMQVAYRQHEILEIGSSLPISNFSIEGAVKYLAEKDKEDGKNKLVQSAPEPQTWIGNFEINNIYIADTTSIDFINTFPENSVDMIFTDPPYDENALVCYEALGRLGAHVLKPGGWCAAYCGHVFLPEVMNILGSWLDYEWTMCIFQPDSNWQIRKMHVFCSWRPIVFYRKPGTRKFPEWIPDALRSVRNKQYHEWQQGFQPIQKYIEAFTLKNELVLDPFVGGGTIPWVCKNTGRNFLAFDKDPQAVSISLGRLNDGSIIE